jgi:hypothetical protein
MSQVFSEKAVYYRTTTDGKTKWVKIKDVAYREWDGQLITYAWNRITRPGDIRQEYERARRD